MINRKHEAWRKGTNKVNFCGNVRLPYSQGKYYEQKPSVRFTWWEGDEERNRTGIRKFFWCKNVFSDRFHLESNVQNSPNFRSFWKWFFVQKPNRSRSFDPKEGRLYEKARLPPLHQVWEVRKKRARSAAWNLCYEKFFLLIKLLFTVLTLALATTQR